MFFCCLFEAVYLKTIIESLLVCTIIYHNIESTLVCTIIYHTNESTLVCTIIYQHPSRARCMCILWL